MRSYLRILPFALAVTSPAALLAQTPPPANNVFTIFRESVKIGKGDAHDAHETAWARAMAATKDPVPFIAMTNLTGPAEIWYMSAYPTWADYEKANDGISAAAKAVGKQYRPAETEYLNDGRTMILRPRTELGYGGPADLPNMRYISVTRVSVRPGHTSEYEEGRKMAKAAHEAAHLTDSYSVWEVTSGAPAGTFYQFVARKSLAEIDAGATIHGPAYIAALGGDSGQKKLAALTSAAVISQETDHFEFTPSQSVAPPAWITANPGYWKPKAATPKKP
jgi:hypothetical protein